MSRKVDRMKKITILLIIAAILLIIPIHGELVTEGDAGGRIVITSGGGKINDSAVTVYVVISTGGGFTDDGTTHICIGAHCHVFPTIDRNATLTTIGGTTTTTGGGGGSASKNFTCPEDYQKIVDGRDVFCSACKGDLIKADGVWLCTQCQDDFHINERTLQCEPDKTFNYYFKDFGNRIWPGKPLYGCLIIIFPFLILLLIILKYTPLGKKLKGEGGTKNG